MLKVKSILAVVAILFTQNGFAATQFETDRQNFYVDGQSINDALSSVNTIMCYVAAMRPDAFVNDGAYAATIYEEDCETGAADASSEASSATATSSSSSSTASSTTTTTGEGKTANTAVLQVSRLNSISPVKSLAWVSVPAQNSDDPSEVDMKIYVDTAQSGGITSTSPNGDFEMNFSQHVDGASEYFRNGQWMGEGYIAASGGSLKYKEFGQGSENDIAAVFLANGDKRGVYKEFAGFLNWDFETQGDPYWWEPGFWENATEEERQEADSYHINVQAIYQFYLSAADKGYCRRLSQANQINWPTQEIVMEREQAEFAKEEAARDAGTTYEIDWDSIHAPVLTPVYQVDAAGNVVTDETTGAYSESGLVIGEECFTIDRTKAQRNVHRYGVYNTDGSRLANNNPGFPMLAEVPTTLDDGTEITQRVHAWADYWGVHVDPRGRSLVTADTIFEKESHGFVESSDTVRQQYKLQSTDIRIEKRTTSYLALNDIDGITLAFWAGDQWWNTEFRNLLGAGTDSDRSGYLDQFQEFEGSYDADTSTFTFSQGINFNNGYEKKDLTDEGLTDITFTTTQWQDAMYKEWGVTIQNNEDGTTTKIKEDWYHKEVRNLGVWSHDTRQWYEVTSEAMADPTSAVKAAGIRTETTEFVSPGDVAETLYCIRECLDGSKVPQTFEDALSQTYDEYGYVTSPYFDIGEYIKEDVTMTKVERGFWNFSEAAEDFNTTIGTNTDNRILVGKQAAYADYVNGDPALPLYTRADGFQDSGTVSSDGKTGDGSLRIWAWDGFSSINLNKLLSKNSASDYGVVPAVHLDLKEIPAAGSSGRFNMIVTVLEGDDSQQNAGERAVSSEAELEWNSDGTTFTVTVPPTASTTMTLVTRDNVAFSGTYGNSNADSLGYAGGQIMTGTAGGDGITYKMFRIFGGHHDLDNLYTGGLGEFFEPNRRYIAKVDIQYVSGDNLTWSMDDRYEYSYYDEDDNLQEESGGQINTVGLQKLKFFFGTYNDDDVTREETYRKGEYREGLQLADMGSYTQSGGEMLDQNGVALGKGDVANAALAKLERPEDALRDARFRMPDNEWDSRSVSWGIRTGELAPASELDNLECRKNGLAEEYDNHPVYGRSSDIKRYCSYKMWEDVNVKYNIMLETRPNYEVIYANAVDTNAVVGEVVEIDEPKTMYFEVPETTDANGDYLYGKDHGKRIRLEYNGHGNLWGIPGFVYDTATGEDLGEFVNQWKDTYRYISRFTMADGAEIEDGVDSSVKYKVKALDGEEWLTPADGSVVGVADLRTLYTALYDGDESDLVANRKMRNIGYEDWDGDGINDNDRYIGDEPTPTVNNGETAVVHGEIIYDPTP